MTAGRVEPTLAGQPWLRARETRLLIDALTVSGSDVRFVGGCVRDALVGRTVRDIDVATPDTPERVCALLAQAGIRTVPTGIEHGTVTAIVHGRPFEVTTLRRDVETFGRRARVAFTDDWVADAARRDFTMNAMSCRRDGTLFDPFGGYADLTSGRVRFVGDPTRRIAEDVLRLLRFFRFYAHYGTPPPDAEALDACQAAAHLLPTLSAERVRQELLRLLEADSAGTVLRLMADCGVLVHVLPEAVGFDRIEALIRLERRHATPDPLRRLAALLPADPSVANEVGRRLRLSNAENRRLSEIAKFVDTVDPGAEPRAMRRGLYHIGAERFIDLLLLNAAADGGGTGADDRIATGLAEAARWTAPRLPVGGRDAAAVGVKAGPAVGRILAAVEAWWVEEDFRPDRDACLRQLRALANAERS